MHRFFDGRERTVTLCMPPRNERLERSEGRVLNADDAVRVRELDDIEALVRQQGVVQQVPPDGR